MTGAVGAFGKMPGMGDFLRLNLSAGFVQSWDTWLQEGMLAARDRLGAQWEACYLSAPIWRFSLPPLAPGKPSFSGILMPSVDRVGRQYPLTLAMPCDAGSVPLRHFSNETFFGRLEAIALAALEEDLTRDALAARLEGLTPSTLTPEGFSPRSYAGVQPPERLLAARYIEDHHPGMGLWTSATADAHLMFLSHGLPDPLQVSAMFDPAAGIWRTDAVARTA
ncbi:type VI secretion system-associated protein TagF [Pseudooceanicola sp.]|uniref:type VI secretion system-associated protein TagF n=1 Tax=Pseudooceanicola sp. TaxID=1914328 RepID=UPI0035C6B363